MESNTSAKLNWREVYAGTLVLLIGTVFLIAQVVSKLSSRASSYTVQHDVISINRDELYTDLRGVLTVVLGMLGGVLLLRKKRSGWIMSFALLVICAIIAGGSLYQLVQLHTFDMGFMLVAGATFLLLAAIIFLLVPSTCRKMKVGKMTFLPSLLLIAVLLGIYFFL